MRTTMPRKVTLTLLAVSAAVLIGWDVYVALNDVPNDRDTISGIVLGFARRHTIVPFAFGVLMGHLFWPQMVAQRGKT